MIATVILSEKQGDWKVVTANKNESMVRKLNKEGVKITAFEVLWASMCNGYYTLNSGIKISIK